MTSSSSSKKESILTRLAQCCNHHQSKHHNDNNNENENENNHDAITHNNNNATNIQYDKCARDLKILKDIIPKVEDTYRLPFRNCDNNDNGKKNVKNSKQIRAGDIKNLCMFYHSVVMGSFCTFSKQILLQNDDHGMEIFPRIHELLRYLGSEQIINNTMTMLASSSSLSKSTTNSDNDILIADHISFTACILLQSLPLSSTLSKHQRLSHCVIADLVTLLYDLSVIASSNVLSEKMYINHGDNIMDVEEGDNTNSNIFNEKTLEVLILNQSSSSSTRSNEYVIEIESIDQVLSLQSGVFHLLFKLLVLQYGRRHSDDYEEEIGEYEYLDTIDSSLYFSAFLAHNDLRLSLLACIRQVLTTNYDLKLTSMKPSSSFVQTTVLALRNKVFVSNLLLLALPDLSMLSSEGDNAVTSPLWFDLISLIVDSVNAHYQFIAKVLLPILKQKSNERERNSSSRNQYHQSICALNTTYSTMLGTLMTNIFMCPMKPFVPSPHTMWSMRSKVICNLFDCLHYVDHLMNNCPNIAESLTESIMDLSLITLRAIHITLFHNATFTNDIDRVGNKGSSEMTREFEVMKLLVHNHCSLNNIFPVLFRLLRHKSIMTVTISIIVQLPLMIYDPATKKAFLEYAGKMVLAKNIFQSPSNKRRKTTNESNSFSQDSVSDTSYMGGIIDSSFASTLSNFLCIALQDAQQVIEDEKNQDNVTYFSSVEVVNISSSIQLIHGLVGLDLCLEDNTSLLNNNDVNLIMNKLFTAAKIICEYINKMSKLDHLSQKESEHVLSLLESCLGILTYQDLAMVVKDGDSLSTRSKLVASRNELLFSLSEAIMSNLTSNHRLNKTTNQNEARIDYDDTTIPEFNQVVVSLLHQEDINQLKAFFKNTQQACHRICYCARESIGILQRKRKNCMCAFLENLNIQNSTYAYQIANLQIEHDFSFHERCLYYASLHLWRSDDGKGRNISATTAVICGLFQKVNLREVYFKCIQRVLLCHIIKNIVNSPTVTTGVIFDHITSFLKEVKYQDYFNEILQNANTQIEVNQKSMLLLEALSSFTKIVSIHHCLLCIAYQNLPIKDTMMTLQSMSNPYSQTYYYDLMAEKESSIPMPFSCHQDIKGATMYLTNIILNFMEKIRCENEINTESFRLKRTKFLAIALSCKTLHISKLRQVTSSSQHSIPQAIEESPQLLKWIIHSPFVDCNEKFRYHVANKVGPLLMSDNFKILRILYANGSDDVCNMAEKLFNEIDEVLTRHCGVLQSVYSLTGRTNQSISTNSPSTWNGDFEDLSANYSRQTSSILAISSICQSAKGDCIIGKFIIEKSIMRLVRLWMAMSDNLSGIPDMDTQHNHVQVALVAFGELVKLHHSGILCPEMVENSEKSFLPGLFAEILSRGIIERNVYGNNDNSGIKDYKMLIKMIHTFFVTKTGLADLQDLGQTLLSVLSFVDKILPTIITSLILNEDYETLCSCTGFRLYILSELERFKKKSIVQSKEKVVGSKRLGQNKISMSSKDLKQNTARLCSTDDGVKVLTKLLPSLLMEPDRSPLLFYLKTVLRCEVTLGQLIQTNQLKLVEEIMWALGGEESETDCDFIITLKSWLEIKSTSPAVQALRKGAIILKQAKDDKAVLHVNDNETMRSLEALTSLNLVDQKTDCTTEVENWVHKHFMMLFVKCVTIRWKVNKVNTKIQAVKCLRLLIRFMRDSDCTQYITQILTMIDSIMSFRPTSSDPPDSKSFLQLLAMRALAHFVHILLSNKIEAVADNLCKIIVSMFPLFENQNSSSMADRTKAFSDTYSNDAISQAISIMESLSDGENGRKLAPYFNDVPFLPKHPRLQHVKETLKRIGVNVDHPLFVSTEMTSENIDKIRNTPISATSSTPGDKVSHDNNSIVVLRRRLHSFKRLLHHENDNVRKVVLEHLTSLIRGNRELFHILVNTEDASLQFLTIQSESQPKLEKSSGLLHNSGETMKSFYDGILNRCIVETNMEIRQSLAICLGEIGAIDPKYISDGSNIKSFGTFNNKWLLENGAPWKSKSVKIHFLLQLMTRHFVSAFKTAATPTDQHKIGFGIQEVLKMLDQSANLIRNNVEEDISNQNHCKTTEMNPWLRDKLEKAEVLSIIEPFWTSSYKQQDANKSKRPPFFRVSATYYVWLSAWGRYMIESSKLNERSRYRDIFYGCRSAIRSEAGIEILEFLMPLLILDTICFGDESERDAVVKEFFEVLSSSNEDEIHSMEKMELQKAVTLVFTIMETFQSWIDIEIEERFSSRRPMKSYPINASDNHQTEKSDWPTDESIVVIEALLRAIPLSLCAKAALNVGMFAQALRYLEVEARKKNIDAYDAALMIDLEQDESIDVVLKNSKHLDLGLAHIIFGELNDYDSMNAVSNRSTQQDVIEQIREKEANTDWDGVLKLCEHASQNAYYQKEGLSPRSRKARQNPTREEVVKTSYLKALLELGHLDSTLNQVTGMLSKPEQINTSFAETTNGAISPDSLIPFAVQASWRLSRWDSLDKLLNIPTIKDFNSVRIGLEGHYDLSLGKAMLGLHNRNEYDVLSSIRFARQEIMQSLSIAARENYNRTQPYLLKLHCLREIEDTSSFFCISNSTNVSCDLFKDLAITDWQWQARIDSVGTNTGASIDIITTRLALSRLASNTSLEASMWLEAGKKARKGGLYHVAETCLSHASALYHNLQEYSINDQISVADRIDIQKSEVVLQLAKIKHAMGKSTDALLMVKHDEFDGILRTKSEDLKAKSIDIIKNNGRLKIVARSALQATEWMVESGLKSGSEVMARYNLLNHMSPKWEQAHYKFARYLNSVLDSRMAVLARQISSNADDDSVREKLVARDVICQKYIHLAINQFGEALCLGQKHIFQALPRLLTLWFEFTAIQPPDELSETDVKKLEAKQDEANEVMANYVRTIPAISYYSVLPQLISRIGHSDKNTALVVIAILKRVLSKFPAQAMWHLAWLRHSIHPDRQKRGEEIFKNAQKSLLKNEDMKMHDLLDASKGLFKFLIDLAKYQPKKADQNYFNVHQWKGNVELKEFVPPVQAALAVSRNVVRKAGSSETFPKCVPRMRAFSTQVQMMSSKARPKKLTAFAIPEGFKSTEPQSRHSSNKSAKGDIGEMHFLVKREARGDLRKDARVQDLNNVINRLLSTSTSGRHNGIRQHRRLQLRTFSVVCLSEDCGILEWVPKTDSLRNLVGRSYHPYATHHSNKRRGKRMIDFADQKLRNGFLQCQDEYVKRGNLTKATQMFNDFCLKEYPPLFYWWFLHQFQDPHEWFEARTKFALSSAAWSAVGHVIGLGDRHSENILIDTSNGDCVHVDFDCIFDKGLHLPRPEVVPFRLTPNIIDALGPIGADGTFTGGLSASMKTLRDNKDVLLSVLEPFLKDPVIDWKKQRSQQKQADRKSNRESIEAKRSIGVIEQRLKGMYNLKNPNYRKIHRIDGNIDEDDEVARLLPLSVEGQVQKMIAEASSHENLVQLYVGWMPWL